MMLLAEGSLVALVGWSAVLIVFLVVGLLWAVRIKRRLNQADDDDEPAPAMGFTLSDLRRMHRAGQINDAEFARAKDKIVEAAKKAAERIPAAGGGPGGRDSADAIRARQRDPRRGFDVLPRQQDAPPPDAEPGP